MVLIALVAVCVVVPSVLLLGGNYSAAIIAVVIAGLLQGPLISLTHSTAFLSEDDTMVVVLVAAALLVSLDTPYRIERRFLIGFWLTVALCALAALRSPVLVVGVSQAREVLEPVGLVIAGVIFRDRINWTTVLRFVVFTSVLVALWAQIEFLLQQPLMDATWYYLHAIGGDPASLRDGVPPAYIADLGNGTTTFRPGGPFLNPPTLGLFLGLGAYAVMRVVKNAYFRLVCLTFIGSALFEAYARAGLVIFVLVTFMYVAWVRGTRILTSGVALLAAAFVARQFIQQGNTASHAQGLVSGVLTGLRSPIGEGFGRSGYQALLKGGATGPGAAAGAESLLGLYAAWLGWAALAAFALVIWYLGRRLMTVRRTDALPYWLAVGFLVAAALSESASSASATPLLWLGLGVALAMPRVVEPAYGSRAPRRISRATRGRSPGGSRTRAGAADGVPAQAPAGP
jgi:hypothetical protein